jgi:hypothetical protein
VRDRRYDWLYERQKQPVKQYILERFARELGDELRAWPPPELEWESEALKARYQAGAEGPPREAVLRYALGLARLDLLREFEAIERSLASEGGGMLQSDAERAAVHLLVRLVTERCLWLKEYADGARLSRQDLADALHLTEQALFLVTLG